MKKLSECFPRFTYRAAVEWCLSSTAPIPDDLLDMMLMGNTNILMLFNYEYFHQVEIGSDKLLELSRSGSPEANKYGGESIIFARAALEELIRMDIEEDGSGIEWIEERRAMENNRIDAAAKEKAVNKGSVEE